MTTIILMVWSMPAVVVHCAELAVVSLQTGNLLLQIIRTINTLPPPPSPLTSFPPRPLGTLIFRSIFNVAL